MSVCVSILSGKKREIYICVKLEIHANLQIKPCVKSRTRVIETVLDGDSLYLTLISSIHNLNFNS